MILTQDIDLNEAMKAAVESVRAELAAVLDPTVCSLSIRPLPTDDTFRSTLGMRFYGARRSALSTSLPRPTFFLECVLAHFQLCAGVVTPVPLRTFGNKALLSYVAQVKLK